MTGFFTGRGPVVQVKNFRNQVEVKDSSHDQSHFRWPGGGLN